MKRGGASIFRNQDFFNISFISIIQVNHSLEWLPLDTKPSILGKKVLDALATSCDHTITCQQYGSYTPTNQLEWINASKKKFSYKTQREMWGNMELVDVSLVDETIVVSPLNHTHLKGFSREKDDYLPNITLKEAASALKLGKAILLSFENIDINNDDS